MTEKDHVRIEKKLNFILNQLDQSEIEYADVRVTQHRSEWISMSGIGSAEVDITGDSGFGVRVLRSGAWGYAASIDMSEREMGRVVKLAVDLAGASAILNRQPVNLGKLNPVVADWSSDVLKDPFSMPREVKAELLRRAIKYGMDFKGIKDVSGSLSFRRLETWFASTAEHRIYQTVTIPGIQVNLSAGDGHDAVSRTWPSSHGGFTCTGGFERLENIVKEESVHTAAREAVELVSAPLCPEGDFTIVIAPDQMSMQIHESIGHPLELDRVFGVEANFSGTSFATVDKLGSLQYGSPLLNVVTDPTEKGVLGEYGYDDDGVKTGSSELIRDGILVGYLSGRETASRMNRLSTGNNRAQAWNHYPINRMSNTRIQPGNSSWSDLLAGIDKGIYLKTNRSWSIDDRRESFRFECEVAREITGGKLGKIFRNPSYSGRTLDFWRSCEGIGSADLYENWGTPNCGKGEPSQNIHTSQGSPPARFSNVKVAPSVQKRRHGHDGH